MHCHTDISDGSLSFEQVLALAQAENISHLAITNHDTTQDVEHMIRLGELEGVEIIPGIEISAYDFERHRRVHILGYYITPNHPAIETMCAPLLQRRHEASQVSVQRLMEAGLKISWDQVQSYAENSTAVYKQHIMHALIANGYTDGIYSAEYRKYFARGNDQQPPGIAYVPMTYVDAADAVRAVIAAGGVPVLAHPGQYQNFEYIPELVANGLAGIEVYHPSHGAEEQAKARHYAQMYDLLQTGGSDFHGFYDEKPVTLGSQNPGMEAVLALQARRLSIASRTGHKTSV